MRQGASKELNRCIHRAWGRQERDAGPEIAGAGELRVRGMQGGLPGRVLDPAGDCNPSPRGAQRPDSRYGKCVQECCFCLEPLSRSDGAPSL